MRINHDQMLGERTASSKLIKTIPAILYNDGEFVCTTSDGIEANVSLAGYYRSGYADQDGRYENEIPVFKKIDYGNLVEYHKHFVGGIKEAYYEIYETPYVETVVSKVEGNPQYFKTALKRIEAEYNIDIVWGRGVWNNINVIESHLKEIGAEITNFPWDKMPYFTYKYQGDTIRYLGRGIMGHIPVSLDTSKLPGIY